MGKDVRILDAIQNHDHDRMQWLALAATIIGSDAARRSLQQAARNAPDKDCEGDCLWALEQLNPGATATGMGGHP
jgi:hypothetical protein